VDFRDQVIHDRYVIGDIVGEGADAVVHRAHDRRLDRVVAVKFLRPALRGDPTFVTRFEREARGAASLDHPRIVPVYDYGETADTFFLVMQYLPGGDLRCRLHPGEPLVVEEAVRIAIEVADALGAAHARGIIHRDVKPGNILLTADDHVKVSDFGIAKMLDVPAITTRTALLGSAHYMAPEQASGGGITPAADVYSLGVVLFEMLAGRPPFQGETFLQVALQHLQAPAPALAELNPAMPADLAEVVGRALAKDPEQRFADGSAFATALREQQGMLEPLAPPAGGREWGFGEPATAGSAPRPLGSASPTEAAAAPAAGEPASATVAPEASSPERAAFDGDYGAPHGSLADTAPLPIVPGYDGPERGDDEFADHPPVRGRRLDVRRNEPSFVPVLVAMLVGVLAVGFIASGLLLADRRSEPTAQGSTATSSLAPTGEGAGDAVQSPGGPAGTPAAAEAAVAAASAEVGAATASSTAEATAVATAAPTATAVPTTALTAAPAATSAPSRAPTAAPTSAVAPAAQPVAAAGRVVLDDDAFEGGFSAPRNYRGRTARWLYGAQSPYGEMTATFHLDATPGAAQLSISGIDSENGPKTPIAVVVNDTVIYQGGNPLPKDNWRGSEAPWGEATISIPSGVLRAGRNTLTFKNLAPVSNFNAPPYFMLDQAVITY